MTRFSICYLEEGKHNERQPLNPKVEYIGPWPEGLIKPDPYEPHGQTIFVENIQSVVWNGDEVIIYVSK